MKKKKQKQKKKEIINPDDERCRCKDCGEVWNPFEDEHFNFTCCPVCFSIKISGYGHNARK